MCLLHSLPVSIDKKSSTEMTQANKQEAEEDESMSICKKG